MKRFRRCIVWLVVALTAVHSLPYALAQSSPSPYLIGWSLLRSNQALAAAEAWTLAGKQAENRHNTDGKREAAFAYVLATVAYEQAADARGYARWADAVRLYLEAGLSWELERDALTARWRTLERQLSQASGDVPPTLGRDDQMLADLVQRVKLLDYKGPRTGLGTARDGSTELSNITPQYFAGASYADSSIDIPVPQSRYGEAVPGLVVEMPSVLGHIGNRPNEAASSTSASPPQDSGPTQATAPLALAGPEIAVQENLPLARPRADLPRQFQVSGLRPLTAAERAQAQLAWRYVMANRQSATGLVNGKDSYPVSSVADIAQTITSYVSALSLQFIESEGFESDMRQLLATLLVLPLYNQELFNREYDSRTGRLLDLGARSSLTGSGWSAEDIGRLLLWLRVLGNTAPGLAPATEAVVARLRLSRLVEGGRLHSVLNRDDHEQIVSGLRLGRQQLTAAALSLWGVVLPEMFDYDDALISKVGTISAPADRRSGGAVSPEVFARGVIEFGGIDACFETAARGLLGAQHALAKIRGQPVMVADELLDRSPWFVYGALAAGSELWRVADFDQQLRADLATFSLKAAYLWAAIDPSEPTMVALSLARSLERSERGLYGGRYLDGRLNMALTLDTNASVLLAAHYTQRGGQPIMRVDNPADYACPGLLSAAR